MARLISEDDVLGPACFGQSGWLEVGYQDEDLHSMYMVGDTRGSSSLDGGPLLDAGSNSVLSQLDGGRAAVLIANPNSSTVTVQLLLQTSMGSYSQVLGIPPVTSWSARASDLFPTAFAAVLLPAYPVQAAFLVVDADLPVACSSMLQRDQDSAVNPGTLLTELPTDASFPYVVQGGGFETEAVLVNPSSQPVDMILRLLGEVTSGPVRIQLPSSSGGIYSLREIFGLPGAAMVRGALNVRVLNGPGVAGCAWLHSPDYRIMTSLSLEPSNTAFVFPHTAQSQGYWTGVSITNASESLNRTTVGAWDADGNTLGEFIVDLMPGEQRVALLYQWIPTSSGLSGGRVGIRSAGPLLAAEIFGNSDISFISVVPGK